MYFLYLSIVVAAAFHHGPSWSACINTQRAVDLTPVYIKIILEIKIVASNNNTTFTKTVLCRPFLYVLLHYSDGRMYFSGCYPSRYHYRRFTKK